MTLDGKRILVTGGTGSLGQALVQRILETSCPEHLIVFSRDEAKQFYMRQTFNADCMRYFLGDIRDKPRLELAFEDADIVIHAAALKQVDTLEYNPEEAIKTNIGGAQNIVSAALSQGVQKVLAVSTDKAVSPLNVYGATKLVMERLIIQSNSYTGHHNTRFSCVRYGNVMGSRGSVIPVWKEQSKTGSLTITDPRMTRFLITLPQAAEFVLSSLEMMKGGETFIPRLPSIKMIDLAQAIGPNCELNITGIRIGEKLHETLISRDESRCTKELCDRYVVLPLHPWWTQETYIDNPSVANDWEYTSEQDEWRIPANEALHLMEEV